MTLRRVSVLAGLTTATLWLMAGWGCSGVNQIDDQAIQEVLTLTVAYGDPGASPDPCNDVLPMIDGVAQDQEWSSAKPILVQMNGDRGNGGDAYILEVRAIWTDESRLGGEDRVYFLVRYPDNDQDINPDLLIYGEEFGIGNYVPTAPPTYDLVTQACDTLLVSKSGWDRTNVNGREDQVLFLIEDITDSPESALDMNLMDANAQLLGQVGPETPAGVTVSGVQDVDFWIFRAGRSNLHPVWQFANWNATDPITGLPDFIYSRFQNKSGFAEDLWIDGTGAVVADAGDRPYVKNFRQRAPVPDRFHPCPLNSREPTEEELAALNGGIPNDLGLWWPTSQTLQVCDTLACSRVGVPRKWSTRLLRGEVDKVQGWALALPSGSARDVRCRATYEALQEKGFATWTLEMMRLMDTGRSDDLPMDPTRTYRMVIGVLDASGKVGSGSAVILLKFDNDKQKLPGPVRRC